MARNSLAGKRTGKSKTAKFYAKNPKSRAKKKKLTFKRKFKRFRRKIRRFIMDAFRNAKEIVRISDRIGKLENKLNKEIADPREDKIDYALEAFRKAEADHTKRINSKLIILILLWIFDKVILLLLFKAFNGVY